MLENTEVVSIDFATNQAIRTVEGVEERQPLRSGPTDFAVVTWADGTTHQSQVSNLLLLVDRAPLRSGAKTKAAAKAAAKKLKRPAAAKKKPAAAMAEELESGGSEMGQESEEEEEEEDDPDEQEDEEPPAADDVPEPPEEKKDRRVFEHQNVHLPNL